MKNQKSIYYTIACILFGLNLQAQPTWTLWASGLPAGIFPQLSVAPNHDIFYGSKGSSNTPGIIYKGNTTASTGTFNALPAIQVPSSLMNNIMVIICNVNSEPIVGFFRSQASEPFLFKYNTATNNWISSNVDFPPNLGAFCSARAANGDIYVGAKWSYIYKSTDNGNTFSRIDETSILKNDYPCYYPTWGAGNPGDGAIYSINVDANGRVYAGTEGAGVIFSDDAGISWKPADLFACQNANNSIKDSSSSMIAISNTGNLGAIGFTANNNVIFNGVNKWTYNWSSSIALADMSTGTITPAIGFPKDFIGTGLQVTKIVTASTGQIFLHSGSNGSVPGTIGIYTSMDGVNWSLFNNGISGANTAQAQGSLAVDGNKVFMATTDGKIWMYDASLATKDENRINSNSEKIKIYPNPIETKLRMNTNLKGHFHYKIFNITGLEIQNGIINISDEEIDVANLSEGFYTFQVLDEGNHTFNQKFMKLGN